jgi:hypothetical protein
VPDGHLSCSVTPVRVTVTRPDGTSLSAVGAPEATAEVIISFLTASEAPGDGCP